MLIDVHVELLNLELKLTMSAEMGHSVLMSFSKTAPGLPAPSIRETPIDEASGRIGSLPWPSLHYTQPARLISTRPVFGRWP
jgi:hypothetical protein